MSRGFCGGEDCLHLNVYTKQLTSGNKHFAQKATEATKDDAKSTSGPRSPVMVFFHGGAFMFGSNTKDFYSPEYLLRKDVVLVVVNYRLGALGKLNIVKYNWLEQCVKSFKFELLVVVIILHV